jgi:hypothetical protein
MIVCFEYIIKKFFFIYIFQYICIDLIPKKLLIMKKIIFLIIFLNLFNSNAQKYFFNTLTKYNIVNRKGEIITYSNLYNDTYFLKLKKYENTFIANLYDYKNLKNHEYSVTETKIDNEFFFNFKYEKTNELNHFNKKNYNNYIFDFETISSSDNIKKVKMKVFKNSKKKKLLMEYELDVKNSDYNYFPAFRNSCIHPYEFLDTLNTFEKGVVISAIGNSLSGDTIEFRLEVLKQVNFELEVLP